MKARYSRRLDAAELRTLYIEQRKGCPQIGLMVGADPTTIHNWLIEAGIPTRARGDNPAVQFKKGERSRFAGRTHRPESLELIRASTVRDGRVPYLRDGVHWLKGAPPEANPRYLGGATPERQEFYRSAEWKSACRAVWQRADAHCQRCGLDWRDCDREITPTFHVHHVWPFRIRETRANPMLMVLLCRPCHLFVHSKANLTREFLVTPMEQVSMPDLFALENAS